MANLQDEVDALRAQVAALTSRLYRLEQQAELSSDVPPVQRVAAAAPPPPPPRAATPAASPGQAPPSAPWQPATLAAPKREEGELERKIGQVWLNRIGIMAVLVGIALFLMYAFQNKWIGPTGQVTIGVLLGIGLLVWSELFRSRGYIAFSYSLKAVGIGALYSSFWAAFKFYDPALISGGVAFGAMAVVTAATIVLAVLQDAELLALYALLGGFSTPLLVSTGENHEIALFSYVCLLDLAILVLTMFKPWKRQLWVTFAGTLLFYWGWYDKFYGAEQRFITVCFAAGFAAIFAAIPLVTPYERSGRMAGPSITLMLVPLLNAANFFLALFAMYESQKVKLTWYALGLAAAYLGMSSVFKRRFPKEDTKVINLLHVAIAIAFITIAVPLKLDHHWITIGWLVESAVLLWIAVTTKTSFLRYMAGAALALGIIRLLVLDSGRTQTMLALNPRFITYLVAIAIMGAILYYGERYGSDREQPLIKLAGIALNLLALIALTLEAADYFSRQMSALYEHVGYVTEYSQLQIARNFSYSAIWLVYGAGLMAFGFWKRSAFVRWQALVLMAFTIGKVFIYDSSNLEKGYRILSFIGLGVVLLIISFIYQRDWLKLSPRAEDKSS